MDITQLHRSSFSQHNLFDTCPRSWYYSSILKVPQSGEMHYANAGTCIHKSLDKYYNEKCDVQIIKEFFETQWSKFNLQTSPIKLKKDEYWLMVLNGIQLNKSLTSTEMKIFYPEVVAYLDGVDSNNDEIIDWKSSTRSEENEHEYKKQLQLYAWLYFRKFNRMPKKCTIYYLKYNGTKGEMSFTFNEEDIKSIEKWFYDISEKMVYYIAHPSELPPFNTNFFFSPYKNMWGTETGEKIKFTLHIYGNHIQLDGPVTDLLEKGIIKKFSYELKDAFFIKKHNSHARTTINFWNSQKRILPLGFRDGLLKTLQDYAQYKKLELDLEIKDYRIFNTTSVDMPDKFINDRTLRDYQLEAADKFIRNKVGILQLGTGAGKTEISIELIRRIKHKTLFVVDKVELLKQTKRRIEECLGIECGCIGSNIEDIRDVTVATIQTLNKNINKYQDYLSSIRFVILDECHKVAANSYVKLSRYLIGAEYRLGLSATPFRTDGNDMQINAVTGYPIYQMQSKELIEKGFLVKPNIFFIKNFMSDNDISVLEDQCKILIQQQKKGLINETVEDRVLYNIYYDRFIHNNDKRNLKIFELTALYPNKKILILTKLVDHGQQLNQLIPGSIHLYGATSKQEREQMFNDFVKGDKNILISTISIFAEGIDIKEMKIIINACANTSDIKTIQMLGRVLRKSGDKVAEYYDFIDDCKFFNNASYKRLKTLRKQGHTVEVIE